VLENYRAMMSAANRDVTIEDPIVRPSTGLEDDQSDA
jgi:hypothetical protein